MFSALKQRGYLYALSVIARDRTQETAELEALSDGAIECTDFDRGIQAALRGERESVFNQ